MSEAFTLGPKEGYRIRCELWNDNMNVWHLPLGFVWPQVYHYRPSITAHSPFIKTRRREDRAAAFQRDPLTRTFEPLFPCPYGLFALRSTQEMT